MDDPQENPEQGQLVLIRRRPATVRNKFLLTDPQTSETLNLIDVEYVDGWNFPLEDRIVWEREVGARILSKVTLPDIASIPFLPDKPEKFQAFVNAIAWTTTENIHFTTYSLDLDGKYRLTSPWRSAVQIEDYQLYPVLKALFMPRVRLLLADDVGLGKTIEAGLILTELISQRRIRRILIICPASIQVQWQEEMKEKFNLDFTIMDRSEVFNLQRTLGMDANPWTTTPRIITSMDYLRQQDVRDQFCVGSSRLQPEGAAMLPWDLLIVDEAHHLAPSIYGDDSLRCQMLREISKYFEHRLFLTATPHNGYTVSFTGLLELLDPLRFQQKAILEERDAAQIQIAMIRRMKSELNERRAIPRFPLRRVVAISLGLSDITKKLFEALRKYRNSGLTVLRSEGKRQENLGRFIFSLLTKRLLSSPYSFARTWWAHIAGFELEDFDLEEANHSRIKAEMPVPEDMEKDRRELDAVRHGAGWIRKYSREFSDLITDVSTTLHRMGFSEDVVSHGLQDNNLIPPDTKIEALVSWIEQHLLENGRFKRDERLIVFTEYRDTQDYIIWHLRKRGWTMPHVQVLFGGTSREMRAIVKREFNDPQSALRILVATDIASEGLNLQTACRYVSHYEIPWNPMRLEQRNGRVDRHGQARDVSVSHFASDDDADLDFLARVVKKVNQVREDLGSAGKVLDEAVMEYFAGRRIDPNLIERQVDTLVSTSAEKMDLKGRDRGAEEKYENAIQTLRATEISLGLSEKNLAGLMKQAVVMEGGELVEIETPGFYRFSKVPPSWEGIVASTLRIKQGKLQGSLPKLVFDPKHLEVFVKERPIFRSRDDTVLLRLGHPVMQKALTALKNHLWDISGMKVIKRWTIVKTELPPGIDAIAHLVCTVVVRNSLGEIAHSEIRRIPQKLTRVGIQDINKELWAEISHQPREELTNEELNRWQSIIYDCWLAAREQLEAKLESLQIDLETSFRSHFSRALKEQKALEIDVFNRRIKELELEKNSRTLEKLRNELIRAEEQAAQLTLIEEINQEKMEKVRQLQIALSDAEWERQQSMVQILRKRLEDERERVIERVLPKRLTIASVDVRPVAVEIIVKRTGGS